MIPINLPKPSNRTMAYINYFTQQNLQKKLNNSKEWFNTTQRQKINCASGYLVPDKIITSLSHEEYVNFFPDENFDISIGILQNVSINDPVAFVPPHIDRGRTLGLMFIVETGGINTTTTFYKTPHTEYTPQQTVMVDYNDLESVYSIKTLKDQWYLIDVQQFHSVENIETHRILCSINFYGITYSKFKEKYKNYLI